VRCTFSGALLPAWLPIPNAPERAMLLHHLGIWHLAEVQPYLRRMETEALDTGGMELFERVELP
jgi:hypothetical protein